MKLQDFWAAKTSPKLPEKAPKNCWRWQNKRVNKTSPIQKKEKDVVSNCTIPEERMVQFVFVIPDISHSSVKF